jgi:hypothetical protein
MRIFSASSCCSAGGSRRICSRISAALMSPIYRRRACGQAKYSSP